MATGMTHTEHNTDARFDGQSAAARRVDARLLLRRGAVLRREPCGPLAAHAQARAARVARWLQQDGLADVAVLEIPADARRALGLAGAPAAGRSRRTGRWPVVTGLLPGRTRQEFVITAYLEDPAAGRSISGLLLALAIGRLLARWRRRGWQPVCGVRFVFPVAAHGLTAILNRRPQLLRRGVLGLIIADPGGAQAGAGWACTVADSLPPLPDPALSLLLRNARRDPGLRVEPVSRQGRGQTIALPMGFSAITLLPGTDHMPPANLGTPPADDAAASRRMAAWIGGHVGRLCAAGPAEIRTFARLAYRDSRQRLAESACAMGQSRAGRGTKMLRYAAWLEQRRLDGWLRLLPPDEGLPWDDGVKRCLPPVRPDGLTENEATRALVARLSDRLAPQSPAAAAAPNGRTTTRAARLVPLKTFRGSLAAGALTPPARRQLGLVIGASFDREGVPGWLQQALAWSNGKRTLAEIATLLRCDAHTVTIACLGRAFRLLASQGLVRWRPYLKQRDLERALRAVGVRRGMLLMTHSSLSAYGYVEGGAATIVGALRRSLGAAGTLAMPTHTVSHFGRPPYRARSTPSTVGAVTEAFRQMAGVRRSPHPTHSVAACGPLAEALLAGHTGGLAPLARAGVWGRFIAHDGWVLMLAPLRKNTLLHAAELWSGVKLPGLMLARARGARGPARTMPAAPLHTSWFDLAHARLLRRGRIASVELGEGTVYLMRGRDVVDAGMAVLRDNPLRVTEPGCTCRFCETLRREHSATTTANGSPDPK